MKYINKAKKVLCSLFIYGGIFVLIFASLNILNKNNYLKDVLNQTFYAPSQQMQLIKETINLTPRASLRFDATHAELYGSEEFNKICSSNDEFVSTGCYYKDKIYILYINTNNLSGLMEVSTAHELLHAMWDIYSKDKQSYLSDLLDKAYEAVKTDELISRMEYYEEHQPGSYYTELHSIIGTEFSDLPDELEAYYAEIFNNRESIVDLHTQYFEQLLNSNFNISNISSELNSLKEEIDSKKESYEAQVSDYKAQQSALEEERLALDKTDADAVEKFNQKVNDLNAGAEKLNSLKEELDNLISEYNEKYAKYEVLSEFSNSLLNELSGK